jgi:hypothetical protein
MTDTGALLRRYLTEGSNEAFTEIVWRHFMPIAYRFYIIQRDKFEEVSRLARALPDFGEELVKEIEAAWAQPQAEWAR